MWTLAVWEGREGRDCENGGGSLNCQQLNDKTCVWSCDTEILISKRDCPLPPPPDPSAFWSRPPAETVGALYTESSENIISCWYLSIWSEINNYFPSGLLKTNLLIITLFPLMFGCSSCFVLFIRYLPITAILMTSPARPRPTDILILPRSDVSDGGWWWEWEGFKKCWFEISVWHWDWEHYQLSSQWWELQPIVEFCQRQPWLEN